MQGGFRRYNKKYGHKEVVNTSINERNESTFCVMEFENPFVEGRLRYEVEGAVRRQTMFWDRLD